MTHKHRILWLASWYPNKLYPFDGDFVQRHARAAATVQPVHVVHVVKDKSGLLTSGTLVEETRQGDLRETIIYYHPAATGWKKLDSLLSFLTFLKVFRSYLQKEVAMNGKPALVHVQIVMRAGIMARWLKQKYGIAYLITEQWTGYYRYSSDNYFQRDRFFRYFTRLVLKGASLLTPVSKDLGETISHNILPLAYTVVPNVADTSLFRYAGTGTPVFRFIHVSSLSYQKNVEGILRCFQQLLQAPVAWECVMAGPAEDALKLYSNSLGLQERVHWAGELAYEKVAEEMRQASCFVLFSRFENLPCVLVEAACCGLPAIAPRLAGIPEIVDTENGILVEPGNEEALLQAMKEMLADHKRFNRKKISEKAVSLFNYERIGNQLKEIYRTML